MLPSNKLSTSLVYSNYLSPDNLLANGLIDYELGGIGLSDPSAGLMYQVWTATLEGIPGEDDTSVWVGAPNTPPSQLFAMSGITEISLTFDQNMKPVVAFTAAGDAFIWWYDATLPGYRYTQLTEGSKNPKCSLDDKRPLGTLTASSDIILAYIRDDNLYHRRQRDRYATEYLLQSDLSSIVLAPVLNKVGMNSIERFQFYIQGAMYTP